jgi:hypothetical protein
LFELYAVKPFKFVEIDIDYVLKQLKTLRVNKAIDIDGLSSRLLRVGAIQIVKPLTHIMNLSLSTAIIPAEWKEQLSLLSLKMV